MFHRTKLVALVLAAALTPTITPSVCAQAGMGKPTAPAATPAKPAAQPEAPKARALPYQGTVDRVNKTAKTFTTKTKEGKEHVFHLIETSKIEKDGAAATIDDIKSGEIVRGSRIKLADNKWEVRKVIIGAKQPGAGKN